MPSDRYEAISIQKGLKQDLKRMKQEGETYTDVMRRALVALNDSEDRVDNMFSWLRKRQIEQAKLQVRMAKEMGIGEGEIPDKSLEIAAWDGYDDLPPGEWSDTVREYPVKQRKAEFEEAQKNTQQMLEELGIDEKEFEEHREERQDRSGWPFEDGADNNEDDN